MSGGPASWRVASSGMAEETGTRVDLDFLEGQRNFRLLFGAPRSIFSREHTFGITRRTAVFAPGACFGLDLWEGILVRSRSGVPVVRTTSWQVLVLEAGQPGERVSPVPQVRPGAQVLLEARGARRCRDLLRWLAELERDGELSALPREFYLARDFWRPATRALRSTPVETGRAPYGPPR